LTADWRAQNPDIEPAEKLLERIRKERRRRWEEDELAKMKAKGRTPKDDKWKKKYKEPEPVDIIDLPELPEGWCWGPLEILGIHQSGIAYKSKDFTNSGIQVIKLGNLYQGRFDLSRDPTFLPQDHPAVFEGLLHPGDLIISQTGTRFKRDYGNFVIIPDDAEELVLNQRLLRVRLVESSLAKWVLYTTRLSYYRDYFFSRETGGVNQGNVGVEGVMRGPTPFAPYQEMKVILRQLEDITKYTENIEIISKKEIKNLSQIDQSILAKAFRGELVPQDPNDEPAEQLLARIKLHASKMPKSRAMKSRSTKRD
jgi:type I restriction enzyme S subunit